MIRAIAICTALGACLPAWSQVRSLVGCTPTSLTEEETTAILASLPDIPDLANLESACYYTSQRLTGPGGLSEVRSFNYRFVWPTGVNVGGTRFYRRAACRTSMRNTTECPYTAELAMWKGNLVEFGEEIPNTELVQLLGQSEAIIPGLSAVVSISRTYVSHPGDRFAGLRRYEVVARVGDEEYVYTIERECVDISECEWAVTKRERYYPPMP